MATIDMNAFMRPAVRLKHPRLFGLMLVGLGIVLNGINVYEAVEESKYYVMALLMGPLAILFGIWRLVIGQPWNETTNKMKTWVHVGDAVSMLVGLAISAAIFGIFNEWW